MLGPITGFTLELDGTPEAVERVLNALGAVFGDLREEAIREEYADIGPTRYTVLGLMPVHGKVTLRGPEVGRD